MSSHSDKFDEIVKKRDSLVIIQAKLQQKLEQAEEENKKYVEQLKEIGIDPANIEAEYQKLNQELTVELEKISKVME